MTAIRAITFDFWCTLFRDENSEARKQVRVEALANATGISLDAADEVLKQVWVEFDRHHRQECRTLLPEDAVRIATGLIGVDVGPLTAQDLGTVFSTAILAHPPVPIEGALEAVQAAAALWPIGIISDTGVSPGTVLRELLDRHAFTPSFTAMTFSDEVGVSKPRALMFETSARALGVAPPDLLHIGDLERTDIAGAKGVGAKAALFAGDNDRDLHHTQADYTFLTWGEFLNILPELR